MADPLPPSFTVWVIGGRLRTETQALVPPETKAGDPVREGTTSKVIAAIIEEIGDPGEIIAFMRATAVASKGFVTNTEQETAIKKEMICSAQQVVFLVDHSKFIEAGGYPFLKLEDVHRLKGDGKKTIAIITDRELPRPVADKLREAGIDIRLVSGDQPPKPAS